MVLLADMSGNKRNQKQNNVWRHWGLETEEQGHR